MKRTAALLIVVVALGGCNLTFKGGKAVFSQPVPQPSAGCKWTVLYSPNVQPCISDKFTIPSTDGAHYIVKSASKPIQVGQSMSLTFDIEGKGKVVPVPGTDEPPARLKLYIQQAGDSMTAADEFKRWWTVQYVDLVAGRSTLNVKIDPANWSQVYGRNGAQYPGEFKTALSNAANVGFTLGGKSFAGHGVMSSGGTMKFIIKEFAVK